MDNTKFEVLLMTNFDLDYDGPLNLYVYNIGTSTVGEMLTKALVYSRGQIIVFLDDDDMFERNKLNKVYKVFTENPSLIYYHNRQKFFYKIGKIVDSKLSVLHGKYTNEQITYNLLKYKNENHIGELFFNLSSCALRKEVLLDKLDDLSKIKSHTDDFMFFVALMKEGEFYYDDEPLTIYRIHDSSTRIVNAGRKVKLEREISLYEDLSISTYTILHIVKDTKVKSILFCRLVKESVRLIHLSKDKQRILIQLNLKTLIKCFRSDSGGYLKHFVLVLYYIFLYIT